MKIAEKNGIGKRGQVTLFIIAGVVILFAAFLVGYIQNESFRQRVESQLFGAAVVPEQAKGVVSYINNCIEDIAKQGLVLLGSQGGYIEIPQYIRSNPDLVLEFDENTMIPFWLYNNQDSIPDVEDMELQLDGYINGRLDECDLSGFGLDNNLIIGSTITKNSLVLKLTSPIEVLIKDKLFDLSDYVGVEIQTNLKKMYDIGRKIINEEIRTSALEFNTLNLLSVYGVGNKEEIPPISGFDIDCSQQIWIKPEVKRLLRDILTSNLIYVKVIGSENYNVDPGFYESMTWDINDDASGLNINFLYYPEWPLFLDVSPSDGVVIKGDRLINSLPILFLCMNFYNFRYDIDYPIVIDISDDTGFKFRFPLEVVIRDNFGRRKVFGEEFFDEKPNLFCDLNQRLSGNIFVNSFNADGSKLGDADVVYTCGGGESCVLGKTNQDGEFLENFPLCSGGRMDLIKEGYLRHQQPLSTEKDVEKSVGGILHKFENKNISATVYDIKNNLRRELREDEEVLLQLNRFNPDIQEYDHYVAVVLGKDSVEEIELVPGLYDIEMSLISNKTITIPEKTIELGPLGVFGKKTIPEITFEKMLEGGAEPERKFIEDLNFDEIELTVLSWGLPESYDDLNKDYNVKELSLEYGSELNLVFK